MFDTMNKFRFKGSLFLNMQQQNRKNYFVLYLKKAYFVF